MAWQGPPPPPGFQIVEPEGFEDWYARIAQQHGLDPNPNDPRHHYDYRAAFESGVLAPDAEGHWPSEFKSPEHPNLIVEGVDTRTGAPVPPAGFKLVTPEAEAGMPPPPPGFHLQDKPSGKPIEVTPPPPGFKIESGENINVRLSDADVAERRARGEHVAEALPYRGFWDRAKQTFSEWRNLDQNTLQVLYRKFLAGQRIDPATGNLMTEDQLRQLHNLERERDEYLLASHEPAEGFLEHAGDLAGIIAKESTAPTALMLGPVGTGKRGLARVGTMAGVGGAYEAGAGAMEQIAREGEITEPADIAIRAAAGAVAAPVLDLGLRGLGKAGEITLDQARQAVRRMRQGRPAEGVTPDPLPATPEPAPLPVREPTAATDPVAPAMRDPAPGRTGTDLPPVVDVEARDLSAPTFGELRKQALDYGRAAYREPRVVNVRSDGTDVIVAWQGIRHGIETSKTPASIKAIKNIHELLENATFVRTMPDRKGRRNIRAVHEYETMARIDGNLHRVKMIVREDLQGRRFYDHVAEARALRKAEPAGTSGERVGQEPPVSHQPAAGSTVRRIARQDDDFTGGASMRAHAMAVPAGPAPPSVNMIPGSRYVGMRQDAADIATAGAGAPVRAEPIRREDVLRPFLKALNVPLYQGRVKGKDRLGFYLPHREAVRVKNKSDLEVAAHELAHLIDDRVFQGFSGTANARPWTKGPNAREYAAELKEISYDRKKVYEGFAEYVRLWMTQPEEAIRAAPQFTRWWENFVNSNQQYGPAIKRAQADMQAWYGQSALDRARSKIGDQGTLAPQHADRGDVVRQTIWDDLHGVLKMERELLGKQTIGGPYETARLTRGGYSVVEGALRFGHPVVRADGSHTFKGKGLEEILRPIGGDLDNWTMYAVGRSARELKAQGRENLFTRAEIEAMLKLETPAFKKAFDEYQVWNKGVVDFAEAKGLINPETRKLWQRTEYLPFYRTGQGQAGGARKGGVEGHWSGIHRLTGGTGNIKDVLGNMIQNASMLITQSLKNEARLAIADTANRVRGGGRFMVKIPKDTRAISVDRNQIQRMVYEMLGLTPAHIRTDSAPRELADAANLLTKQFAQMPEWLRFWQFNQAPRGDNVVAVMRGGKAEFYEVIDPMLYQSIQSLDRKPRHWLTNFLNSVRRVGQATITMTPDFMAANLLRSDLYAAVTSKSGYVPFVDSVKGFKSRVTNDPAYREFLANGGGFSSYLRDEEVFRAHLKRWYTSKGIDYRTVIDTPAKMVYALETLGEAIETTARLGEFRRAVDKGFDPRHAAYLAREASVDYAMRGTSDVMGFFYDSIIFLKPGMNGLDRIYRGFVHDDQRVFIAGATGTLALMSMVGYALMRGNELYEQMERWDRDVHWHFLVPTTQQGVEWYAAKMGLQDATEIPRGDFDQHFIHFRYPKIWEIGAISSIAERTMENILDRTPSKWFHDVTRVAMDLFRLDYMPQLFEPVYEQMLNKSRFTGRPIVPPHMKDLQPFAQATPYTSRTIQEIGMATRHMPESLQISPVRMEAMLRGYFNTWALYALGISDAMLFDDQPDMRLDQYPVLRRFYVEEPRRGTAWETQFYDLLGEVTSLRRTMRYMDRMHRPEVTHELYARPEQLFYREMQGYQNVLSAIHEEMREIQLDRSMDSAEKRRFLDQLQREKNAFLRDIMEDMEDRRAEATGSR